jgi:hypothetical protein
MKNFKLQPPNFREASSLELQQDSCGEDLKLEVWRFPEVWHLNFEVYLS